MPYAGSPSLEIIVLTAAPRWLFNIIRLHRSGLGRRSSCTTVALPSDRRRKNARSLFKRLGASPALGRRPPVRLTVRREVDHAADPVHVKEATLSLGFFDPAPSGLKFRRGFDDEPEYQMVPLGGTQTVGLQSFLRWRRY